MGETKTVTVREIVRQCLADNGYVAHLTIREMVRRWLEDNEYDGLAGRECGCRASDLMPSCYAASPDCEAAHEVPREDGQRGFWMVPGPSLEALARMQGVTPCEHPGGIAMPGEDMAGFPEAVDALRHPERQASEEEAEDG